MHPQANGVENVMVARMSSEEFTEAWRTKRQMKRLEGQQDRLMDNLDSSAANQSQNGMHSRLVPSLRRSVRLQFVPCRTGLVGGGPADPAGRPTQVSCM